MSNQATNTSYGNASRLLQVTRHKRRRPHEQAEANSNQMRPAEDNEEAPSFVQTQKVDVKRMAATRRLAAALAIVLLALVNCAEAHQQHHHSNHLHSTNHNQNHRQQEQLWHETDERSNSLPVLATPGKNVTILLDTTEQTALGWTHYPDGGPGGQGRTPGWSEESFIQMERDINWRSFVTCDVAYESVNNWLWTPYLERGDANRLHIEIKFTMRDCNLFPQSVRSCKETFALLYHEVDEPLRVPAGSGQSSANLSFAHVDDYKLVDAIAADEGRFTSNSDVVINTEVKSVPVSKRGVYFAFRDQGACLSLISIKVYSLSCPQVTTNLARFNSTPVGADPSGLVAVLGECVPNSIQIEQPRMFCTLSGEWNTVTSGQCKCLAGFEPVHNHTKCQACPPGRYKPTAGDSPCLPCPERSYSQLPGATECKCHEGFYRAPKDARSSPCTQPPSGPAQNFTATYVDSTSAILQWQAPRQIQTLANHYQRDDLTYKLLCDSCDFTTLVSSPQFFTNFSETKCVISGLQPGTSYRFTLYVDNGVSLMAAMSNHLFAQQQPFSEITIQTSKLAPQTTRNTLSSQNGLQLLPIYNFRAFPGARGPDMILAWDAQQGSAGPTSAGFGGGPADSLLMDSVAAAAASLSADQQQPSLYEVKFQPRHASAQSNPQEQLMLARRSPYPILFDQQQHHHQLQSIAQQQQQQQSMTTTNRALGLYTLQPRTEYAFQIRAKWAHSSQWTDWSEPIFATTGAFSSSGSSQPAYPNPMLPFPLDQSNQMNFPISLEPIVGWPSQGQLPGGGGGGISPSPSTSSWLSSILLVILCASLALILAAVTLVHYRNSVCLKSLSSSLSGGLMGSNVGSTYAGVYNGGTSSDLIAGLANGGVGALASGNYGSNQTTGALIYHNAPAIHNHQHLHSTMSAGSAGALITGSNSTSRSSSGAGNVVQNFLAATLGQLAGHHHNNNNNNNHHNLSHNTHGHIAAKTLDSNAASQQQHSKLFLGQSNHQLGRGDHSPSGLFLDLPQNQNHHSQHQRNHYHQMLGANVNHTLLFSGHQPQGGPLVPSQYQQQPISIVPPPSSGAGGGQSHNLAQHLSGGIQQQQQQMANGNSPQPPQVADLFIGQQQHHQQQSKYSNSRTLSGQQQQYGLANLHDPQAHIYDDLEVVSQPNQMDAEMLKFGQQHHAGHQTLSSLMQQQQQHKSNKQTGRHQATIYAPSRELYEPTTKLVIGPNGHQQQQHQQQQQNLNQSLTSQQQQARAKLLYRDRAEDEFHDHDQRDD